MLILLKDQKAETIILELMDHYVYVFSAPKSILTDNGSNFVYRWNFLKKLLR